MVLSAHRLIILDPVQRLTLELDRIQVIRPVELLGLYEPYWKALELEFERRRAT